MHAAGPYAPACNHRAGRWGQGSGTAKRRIRAPGLWWTASSGSASRCRAARPTGHVGSSAWHERSVRFQAANIPCKSAKCTGQRRCVLAWFRAYVAIRAIRRLPGLFGSEPVPRGPRKTVALDASGSGPARRYRSGVAIGEARVRSGLPTGIWATTIGRGGLPARARVTIAGRAVGNRKLFAVYQGDRSS